MQVIYLLMFTISFVFFVLAAFNVAVRFNLVAVGLALWVAIPALQLLLRLA